MANVWQDVAEQAFQYNKALNNPYSDQWGAPATKDLTPLNQQLLTSCLAAAFDIPYDDSLNALHNDAVLHQQYAAASSGQPAPLPPAADEQQRNMHTTAHQQVQSQQHLQQVQAQQQYAYQPRADGYGQPLASTSNMVHYPMNHMAMVQNAGSYQNAGYQMGAGMMYPGAGYPGYMYPQPFFQYPGANGPPGLVPQLGGFPTPPTFYYPQPPPEQVSKPTAAPAATTGEKRNEPEASSGPNNVSASENDLADDNQARALKRPRLVWTPQLHQRFVEAVNSLGLEKAVPKTIMQLMNVEGLTRENVASHLQKYRMQLKKQTQQLGTNSRSQALSRSQDGSSGRETEPAEHMASPPYTDGNTGTHQITSPVPSTAP